jgi:DNA-binding IclR family transcriptional regulator
VLDDELLGFIRATFRSTWALELLLLLRSGKTRAYAADDLVLTLRATPALIGRCLQQLQRAGLVTHDESDRWRYAPLTAALDQLTDRLAGAYTERPIAVITAIVEQPSDRLRSFSDAFRFPSKDEKKDE